MSRKVLIANRGEIAIRISYTLREMGIDAAAVFTAADEGALHARQAKEAHLVASYLDIDEMIRTAKDAAADAIHPGYGFLSENAALSAACAEAGRSCRTLRASNSAAFAAVRCPAFTLFRINNRRCSLSFNVMSPRISLG